MNIRHLNTRLFLILAMFLCLSPHLANAQGFIRQYSFYTWIYGGCQSIYPQTNGGFRMTALSYPDFGTEIGLLWTDVDAQGILVPGGDTLLTPFTGLHPQHGNDIFLFESGSYARAFVNGNVVTLNFYSHDGNSDWSVEHTFPQYQSIVVAAVEGNASEDLFVRGVGVDSTSWPEFGFVLKVSSAGNLLWEYQDDYQLHQNIPRRILPTSDGGCLFANYSGISLGTGAIVRLDNNGNVQWTHSPDTRFVSSDNRAGKVMDTNAAGQTFFFTQESGPNYTHWLEKVDANGSLINSVNIDAMLDLTQNVGDRLLVFSTADGGAVVYVQESFDPPATHHLAKINADGSLAWKRTLGFLNKDLNASFYQGLELSDGSLILYGYQDAKIYLIKLSADGFIAPHSLEGKIVRDSTYNCEVDAFDPPFEDWVLMLEGNGITFYANSDANGHYGFTDVDNGDYELIVVPPSYLWQPCEDTVALSFNSSVPVVDTFDIPVQALYDCPLMELHVATPFLRPCFQNKYAVQYCNNGNQAADPVQITIELDPLILLDSASIPFTQDGQLLTFEIGAVPSGGCGNFFLYTTTDCDAELGQTLCVEAHIYPDTVCAMNLPNWSGAQVEVSAECAGDSVQFIIRNTGTKDMPQAREFIIVDDHVITRQGVFQLPKGGIHMESAPADGSTWRLIAEQEPGFPFGPQGPSVGVEACLSDPTGTFTTGMLNMFANYSGNPFHVTHCKTVVGSFDPNDKQALPIGVDAPHFIERNQPLEYLIRFQNTGTDTAFTVIIRDTLSPWLNPASIRPGASSHPYSWKLSGEGILTVTFTDIMLPDSNVNEPASHGFVQFHIDQQPDNPLGAVIENRAGIYFDFNDPVITNTVFHTVGKHFLQTPVRETVSGPAQLQLWPNPATHRTIAVLNNLNRPGRRLILRDAMGRPVREWPVQYLRQEIPRAGVQPGMYWLELRENQRLIAVGKLLWMD